MIEDCFNHDHPIPTPVDGWTEKRIGSLMKEAAMYLYYEYGYDAAIDRLWSAELAVTNANNWFHDLPKLTEQRFIKQRLNTLNN